MLRGNLMNRKKQKQTKAQKEALTKKAGVKFKSNSSKYARKRAEQVKGVFSTKSPFSDKVV